MVVEIAPRQLGPVMQMGREAFPAATVSFSLDHSGQPRLVSTMLPQGTSRPTRRLRVNDGHASSGIPANISAAGAWIAVAPLMGHGLNLLNLSSTDVRG